MKFCSNKVINYIIIISLILFINNPLMNIFYKYLLYINKKEKQAMNFILFSAVQLEYISEKNIWKKTKNLIKTIKKQKKILFSTNKLIKYIIQIINNTSIFSKIILKSKFFIKERPSVSKPYQIQRKLKELQLLSVLKLQNLGI